MATVYLDDNGNPIPATRPASQPIYLDDNGNPIRKAVPRIDPTTGEVIGSPQIDPVTGESAGWTPVNENRPNVAWRDAQPAAAPPQQGMLGKAWDWANKGLVSGNALVRGATLGRDTTADLRTEANAPPSAWDVANPIKGGIRKGLLGMSADTMDTVSSMTSPASLALMATGGAGKLAGWMGKAARAAMNVASVPIAAQGFGGLVNAATSNAPLPDRLQQGLQSGAALAGGLAGATSNRQFANGPIKNAPGRFAADFMESAKRKLLPGTPEQLLVTATKPSVSLPEYEQSLTNALPELAKNRTAGLKGLQGMGAPKAAIRDQQGLKGLVNSADTIRDQQWGKYTDLKAQFKPPASGNGMRAEGPYNPTQVDANPVADAQMATIPATNVFEQPNQQVTRGTPHTFKTTIEGQPVSQNEMRYSTSGDPGIVAKTAEVADRYRTNMPVEQADSIVRDTNGKLRSFYNKQGGDQAAARSNPETERTFQVNSKLRDQLYGTIENGTGVDPAPGMKLYGNAVDIGDTAGHRNTVFSRRQPNGINDMINNGGHPLSWLAGKLIGGLNDNNRQVKWAFDRYGNQQQPKYKLGTVPGAIAAAMSQIQK